VESPVEVRGIDSLRYQAQEARTDRATSDELLFVKLRYKEPDGERSRLLDLPVMDRSGAASEDFRFASAVAAWGMLLRDSEHCTGFGLDDVVRLARGALGDDAEGYRHEFVRLVETARSMELLARDPGLMR
jgi:Ca-activated chloride channel family protein